MKKPLAVAELNELVAGLKKLSRNLWWSWDQEAQDFFYELSPRGWQNLFHNAVAVLREVSEYELRVRLQDADFAAPRPRACCTISTLPERQKHLGPPPRAATAQKSGRLFLRRVRLPRIPAHFRGRPGHPGRRPRKIRQRPGTRLRRHRPVLSRRLFPTGH